MFILKHLKRSNMFRSYSDIFRELISSLLKLLIFC